MNKILNDNLILSTRKTRCTQNSTQYLKLMENQGQIYYDTDNLTYATKIIWVCI